MIDKGFFPLFIASDYFLDAAIKISVGSLSPTINWSDLKRLEFSLPPLDEQKKLAQVLWSAIELKEAYQVMLARCDEMASSRFIEMFDDPQNYGSENTISLGEISEMVSGGTPSSKHPEYFDGDMPFVSTPFLGANYITEKDVKIVLLFKEESKKRFIMGLGLASLKMDNQETVAQVYQNLQRELKRLEQENRILKARLRKLLNIQE